MTRVVSNLSIYVVESTADIYKPDIIDHESKTIVEFVCFSLLGNVVCVFGLVSNIINMVVFVKLGFTDTVNISLVALAVSDFCSLIAMEWIDVLKNPLFANSGIPWSMDDVQHITGAATHAVLARVTSWITAFVTFERCLCVMVPLKVKMIITARVTVVVMVTIYILMILTHLQLYMSFYFDWRFFSRRNMTLIGLLARENMADSAGVSFTLAVLAQLVSFVAVILFTVILVIQMKRTAQWREKVASGGGEDEKRKQRQKRGDTTVKMVILIAVIYIICFVPSIFNYTVCIIEPRISFNGQYKNAFFTAWAVAFLLESVNSSVNIFVYYRVSTKYKAKFNELFLKSKDQSKSSITASKSFKG